jgi:hypothetical protein
VRTRRADADLEDVEDADRLHGRSPSRWLAAAAEVSTASRRFYQETGQSGKNDAKGGGGISVLVGRPVGSATGVFQLDQAHVDRLAAGGLAAVDGDDVLAGLEGGAGLRRDRQLVITAGVALGGGREDPVEVDLGVLVVVAVELKVDGWPAL